MRNLVQPGEGYVFVSADFSQLELRILAHFSQDAELMKAISDPFVDVFDWMASGVFRVDVKEVDKEFRQRTKQVIVSLNIHYLILSNYFIALLWNQLWNGHQKSGREHGNFQRESRDI